MIVEVEDFGISWEKSDKIKHKADFDDLIGAYEKLEKIEHELYLINNAEFEIPNNAYTFLDRIEQIIKG